MSEDLRGDAARRLLHTLPFIMRNVGTGMRGAGIDVSPPQHRLLTMLAAHPRTLSQVAEFQGVTPATATTLITTLESRGWVSREHDPEDRRRVVVTVTDAGLERLTAAQRAAEDSMVSALDPLSDDDVRRLLDGLRVLEGVADTHRCAHPSTRAHTTEPEIGHATR